MPGTPGRIQARASQRCLSSWEGEEILVSKKLGKAAEVSPLLTEECSRAALLQHTQQRDPQRQKPRSWRTQDGTRGPGLSAHDLASASCFSGAPELLLQLFPGQSSLFQLGLIEVHAPTLHAVLAFLQPGLSPEGGAPERPPGARLSHTPLPSPLRSAAHWVLPIPSSTSIHCFPSPTAATLYRTPEFSRESQPPPPWGLWSPPCLPPPPPAPHRISMQHKRASLSRRPALPHPPE